MKKSPRTYPSTAYKDTWATCGVLNMTGKALSLSQWTTKCQLMASASSSKLVRLSFKSQKLSPTRPPCHCKSDLPFHSHLPPVFKPPYSSQSQRDGTGEAMSRWAAHRQLPGEPPRDRNSIPRIKWGQCHQMQVPAHQRQVIPAAGSSNWIRHLYLCQARAGIISGFSNGRSKRPWTQNDTHTLGNAWRV